MLDISTDRICRPSCITLVGAILLDRVGKEKKMVQGPGNLACALDIDKDYNGLPIEISPVWIAGEPIEKSRILSRQLSGLPENCRGYFYFRS